MPLASAGGQAPSGLVDRNGCATATCHGAVAGRGPAWRSAAEVWLTQDPHAGAYRTLWNEQSRRMVEVLDPAAGLSEEAYARLLGQRCVSCHATVPSGYSGQESLPASWLAGGVECQACHGPATDWINEHVRADWPLRGDERFDSQYGMRPTESVAARADGCLRCHLGSRSADGVVRDMNHDLIAAGHPALRFEFLTYWSALPPHWDRQADAARQSGPGWRFSAYQTGRHAGLQAAVQLSGERAGGALADRSVPWPELSEYDCFACHRGLESPGRDAAIEAADRAPLGRPAWNPWHLAGLEVASSPPLDRYTQRMTAGWVRPEQAVEMAGAAVAALEKIPAAQLCPSGDDPGETLRKAFASPPSGVRWQDAAQWYLGARAAMEDFRAWRSVASGTRSEAARLPISRPSGGQLPAGRPRLGGLDYLQQLTHGPPEFRPADFQRLQRSLNERFGAWLESSVAPLAPAAAGQPQP